MPIKRPNRRNLPSRAVPLAAIPSRQSTARAGLILMIATAGASALISRGHPENLSALRAVAGGIAASITEALASPAKAVDGAIAFTQNLAHLRADNEALRQENARLLRWRDAAKALEEENRALRALAATAAAPQAHTVTARIVAGSVNPYTRSALISAGEEDGVKKDGAVVAPEGLIGRVVENGQGSARVLLVTDLHSRVPVIGELSRERGILAGNNSPELMLAYAASHSKLQPSERLLTSGDGGVFPAGIPVAVVSRVQDGSVVAMPLADWRRSDYVSVLDYTF